MPPWCRPAPSCWHRQRSSWRCRRGRSAGCSVDYSVSSQWQGGFGANVAITNLGDAVDSWTLTWTYGAGQTVTQAWNTTLTQSGAAVTARNVSYNGAIPTNGTVSFGFNGSWTGSNPDPTSFALNGVGCTGGTEPTTPPTTAADRPRPPTTPPPTGPADITVNSATRYQTIDGFGAALSIWGSAWSTTETQTLVGMGANQLGLSIVRTGLVAGLQRVGDPGELVEDGEVVRVRT